MSDQVNLLIRSDVCNDDKKIEASLDWTILEVKQQIEADWPQHPPPHDQRLVYAGKLLQDGSRLREVLRLEDLPNPFIIHLVCRQLSPPPTASTSPRANGEGLRRRTATTAATTTSTPSAPSTTSVSSSGLSAPTPWMQSYAGQVDGTSLAFDQAVAMQQMYAQYVNQYMQYLQSAGGHFAAAGIHTWNGAAAGVAHAAVHDPRQADAGNNVLEPMAAAAAAAAVAGGQAVAGNHGAAVIGDGQHQQVNPNMGGGAPAHEVAAAQVGAPNVGPNPPNVVMNANAGGLGAIEDDEDGGGGQRDILDWFYVASRVLVLFSIVYFYSSLARFALVAGVCVVLYLYQIGFFGQPRGIHNNPVRNQPAAPQQPPPQQQQQPQDQQDLIRQQVDEVRQAAGGGNATAEQEDAISQPQAEPEVVSPNYFSVVATFVTTFFSSLIPHEPQVV